MNLLISVPLFAVFVSVALVSLVRLKETPLFWLPGVAVAGYGAAFYFACVEGFTYALHVVTSFGIVVGAAVCLIVGARSHLRALHAAARAPRRLHVQ